MPDKIANLRGQVVALRESLERFKREEEETGCVSQECWDQMMAALASDAGKPEAAVIVAAIRGTTACSKQYAREKACCGMCIWHACCAAVERMVKGVGHEG